MNISKDIDELDDATITLTMSLKQARILSNACEVVSRLHLNQFDVLKELCYRRGHPYPDYDEFHDIELQLKHMFSPELDSNAYWGIFNNEVNNNARTLFDMYQLIRNRLSWYRNPLGGYTVNYDSFLKTDTENNSIVAIINTDDPYYPIKLDFFKRFNHSINQMIDKMKWSNPSQEVIIWIKACEEFAIHEFNHVAKYNKPLPPEEYLDFFNEYIGEDGYIHWKEDNNKVKMSKR